MICQACNGELRVSHTCSLESARTQRLVCKSCGRSYTTVTMIQPYQGRGTGAKALAAKIRRQLGQGKKRA